MVRAAAVVLSAAGLIACDRAGQERDGTGEDRADVETVSLEVVARDLVVPWDLEFAPDGRIFVTERPGRIRVVENGTASGEAWATLDVAATGETGLMGIALAPDFAESGHVYAVGTFSGPDGLENRVIRFTDRNGRGADATVIVRGLPAARFHAGGALDFGPDGMLYVTTGDAREPPAAQDADSRAGKVLRYSPDGRVPADNPLPGSPVYALGVRNPQGLAWHPGTGELFATEHGPSGFPDEGFRRGRDELNAILPGGNHGWPEVAGMADGEPFVPPIAVWTPAIAPAGLALYTGPAPEWRGDLFVGGLRGEQLRRVGIEPDADATTGWRVTEQQVLLEGEFGRIRAVVAGPDGHLYFTTSNRDGRGDPAPPDDRVVRLDLGHP